MSGTGPRNRGSHGSSADGSHGSSASQGRSHSPADFALTRELPAGLLGPRWVALHKAQNTSHLLHRPAVGGAQGADAGKVFERAMMRLAPLTHPHVLSAQCFGVDDQGPWAVTDYTGDADGVVTLEGLLAAKGAHLSLEESRRAIEQLLDAARAGHAAGFAHPSLTMRQVHVDRNGSLRIELYGLDRALGQALIEPPGPEARPGFVSTAPSLIDDQRAEVRAALRIGYQLVTGLSPIEPLIPVEDMVEHIDETWRALFETGLGPTGFTTAAHAWSAAHSCRVGRDRRWAALPVRSLLGGR